MKILVLLLTTILFFSGYIIADETWIVTNINGYCAQSSKYEYVPSKLANSNIKLTFKKDKGLVNESGLNVHRLDNSTLILYNNRKKSSTIEVYQINRDLNKAHILSSRVGSKKLELEFLRDKSCTYNGDAKLIEKT